MALSNVIKRIKKPTLLLVTPKVEQFLIEVPNGVIWDEEGWELFHRLTDAMFGTNDDRSGRFGASSRGRCVREQIFSYLGMPAVRLPDPALQNTYNDGKWRHLRWQMMMKQSGAVTHVEYPLKSKKWRLGSSVDALNSVDQFIVEVKGDRNMARLLDAAGGVVESHNLQIHTMMLMTGWDTCAYIMEDKGSTDWREVIVKRDPAIMQLVRKELVYLNECVEYNRLPPILPACAKKEGPYRSCQYASACLRRSQEGDYWPTERNWET